MKVKLLVTLDVPDGALENAEDVANIVREILGGHEDLPFVEREATWESEGFFGKQHDDYEAELDCAETTVESVVVVNDMPAEVLLPPPHAEGHGYDSGEGDYYGADGWADE